MGKSRIQDGRVRDMEEGLKRMINENFDSGMYRLDLQYQPQEREDGNGKDIG